MAPGTSTHQIKLIMGRSIYVGSKSSMAWWRIHTVIYILIQRIPEDVGSVWWSTGVTSHKASRFSHMKSTQASCRDLGESYIL
jgi:hypothetical protein